MGLPLPLDNIEYMRVKLTTVATALPPYSRTTAEVLPLLDSWLAGQEERFIRKVKKLFENAEVDRRYSMLDPLVVFTEPSLEKRNALYRDGTIELGKACLERALKQAAWAPADLDVLITVSCTGIMIPSLDAYLINELGLRQNILRLPVTEMGCVAGVSGLLYARRLLQSLPGRGRAAVLAVESPTATLQLRDFSMTNMVSAALFGDGAACALLSVNPEDEGPEIVDDSMYHFPDSTELMGFELKDQGLTMVLDPEVPEAIEAHFDAILLPFLKKNGLQLRDVDHLIFHPGGKKILQVAEAFFKGTGENRLAASRAVMREHGNMSSATVLYVMKRFMRTPKQAGSHGLMLSFGPGFTAQQVLLKWQGNEERNSGNGKQNN